MSKLTAWSSGEGCRREATAAWAEVPAGRSARSSDAGSVEFSSSRGNRATGVKSRRVLDPPMAAAGAAATRSSSIGVTRMTRMQKRGLGWWVSVGASRGIVQRSVQLKRFSEMVNRAAILTVGVGLGGSRSVRHVGCVS